MPRKTGQRFCDKDVRNQSLKCWWRTLRIVTRFSSDKRWNAAGPCRRNGRATVGRCLQV